MFCAGWNWKETTEIGKKSAERLSEEPHTILNKNGPNQGRKEGRTEGRKEGSREGREKEGRKEGQEERRTHSTTSYFVDLHSKSVLCCPAIAYGSLTPKENLFLLMLTTSCLVGTLPQKVLH